ncbi:MAG: threonine synthase [Patescibacteria group bacterium]|jgi:threonine synthase
MQFHSTRGGVKTASLARAIIEGLAVDGGLYLPNRVPKLNKRFVANLQKKDFQQIAVETLQPFMSEVPAAKLRRMSADAFNFSVPLKRIDDSLYVLELFHGPTLSFKDFGARFLARLLQLFLEEKKEKAKIIVATSGDTGSAVASGFLGMPNIQVFVLYPKGRISKLQEQQITTYGQNITALEVQGKFDDCQRLAKEALSIGKSHDGVHLSSANSINIGRLLPQSLYYLYAIAELRRQGVSRAPRFIVPSGNFGNLTAGLLAKKMGAQISGFVAATNMNDIVPIYLRTGRFKPRASKSTLSNAMDVGDPSNFARMLELYDGRQDKMARDITGFATSDKETMATITDTYRRYKYVVDPHTAVGITAARKYRQQHPCNEPMIVLSTAHPAKFKTIVERAIQKKISLPRELAAVVERKKKTVLVRAKIDDVMRVL